MKAKASENVLEDEQRQISCPIGEKGERKAENEYINQKHRAKKKRWIKNT